MATVMNSSQDLWWKQARADFRLFGHLRAVPGGWPHECHMLQSLQMATEKISKASFRGHGIAPKRLSHLGASALLRRLGSIRSNHQPLIARAFSVPRFDRFVALLRQVQGIVRAIERLPPAIAGPDRPNTEYPWPHDLPTQAPAEWDFDIWRRLNTSEGRTFLRFLERAIVAFPQYAHIFR